MKTYLEGFLPMKNFYILKTRFERIVYIFLPLIVGAISFVYINNCIKFNLNFKIAAFLNDYINSLITVMALFISFSMAYLSILATSNSRNVDEIKERTSKEYEINKKPVFLYQILMTDLTYSIFIEILLLILLFIQKFMIINNSTFFLNVQLSIDIIMLIHVIQVLLRNIKNIYLTFWRVG